MIHTLVRQGIVGFLSASAKTLVFALVFALVGLSGCVAPVISLRQAAHPEQSSYRISATLHEHLRGYYSAAVTIRNDSGTPLALSHALFTMESSAPTQFVPAERISWGRSGFRMPVTVAPGGVAQGEVFFAIRGSKSPAGPVQLAVRMPDGDHKLVFELLQ
jgi:hypothetical protein